MRKVVLAAWRGSLSNNWELEGPAVFLKSYDGFSALGILCEVYRLMTGNGEWIGYPFVHQSFLGETTTPPDAVMEWADLSAEEVEFLSGKSFTEVKKWLTESTVFLPHRQQQPMPKLTYH